MLKNALVTAISTALLLTMLTACAEDDQTNSAADKTTGTSETVANAKPAEDETKRSSRAQQAQPAAAEPQAMEAFQSAAIMSKPVDFSSPESFASSIQAIQEEAGDEASTRIQSAIDYMLVYDLSVGRNKQKLYEKLDGKTPNEILAMMRR